MQCDRSNGCSWSDGEGADWLMYCFEWAPGPVRARLRARIHRPDVCLSSVGLKLLRDRGVIVVEAGGFSLPFRAYTFEQSGHPLFVYYGLWQTRSRLGESNGTLSESEHIACMQAVLWRERNLGQQVVELAVSGFNSDGQADVGFVRSIKRLLARRFPRSG